MFITTTLKFHSRNEPYPYDMSETGGPVGVSYSIFVWDDDDSKVKIKCADEAQWKSLEKVERGTLLQLKLRMQPGGKITQDGVAVANARAAA